VGAWGVADCLQHDDRGAPGFDSSIILSGVSADYFSLQGIRFIHGNGFTHRDVDDREPVLVLDETSKETLFPGNEDPLGKIVQIAGAPWRVIGIASKPGPKVVSGFMSAWIPYTSLLQRISGDKPLEALTLRFQETLSPQDAARRAERHLIREHGKKISLSRPTNSSPKRCKNL
jgi:macrolide transport system ATP-binding/permease protein